MIIESKYGKRALKLVDQENVDPKANVYTIIVGKNGTGKSRLLGSVVRNTVSHFMPGLKEEGSVFNGSGDTKSDSVPQKIIAVSNSPFDRFPIYKGYRQIENYSYLGVREIMSVNIGLSYMSKIMSSLIKSILTTPAQMPEIAGVLAYLGYTENIRIRAEARLNASFIKGILTAKNKEAEIYIARQSRPVFQPFNRNFFFNEDQSVSKKKVSQFIRILKKYPTNKDLNKAFSIIEIGKNGFYNTSIDKDYWEDLVFLMDSGVVKVRDVMLEKRETLRPFSIYEASSGEQSVVLSILGISSQIKDNSLICIDEPEVCLHPEWQEKYIKILTSTFGMYEGCHFIIATHSPQIVSNLVENNSYILSMETGKIIDAKRVIKQSADFQLAEVFNSPGFKNEFLSRIALNIFSKVSNRKNFDDSDLKNYKLLQGQSDHLQKNDPVLDLYNAISEMYKIYGRYKD